jgi:hypothetical protein
MGVSENITAAIIIIIVFIAGGLAYSYYTAKKNTQNDASQNAFEMRQKTEETLDTALLVTEPVTGRQFGDLLASAVYYRNEIVNVSGREVNVTQEFDSLLRQMAGGQGYFFQVFPKIKSIRLVFMGVADDRMIPFYAVLERDFDNLAIQLQGTHGGNITGFTAVLEGTELCMDIRIDCQDFTQERIYNNNLSSTDEMLKYKSHLMRPASGGEADWESMMSYYMLTTHDLNMTDLEVFFPLMDRLPGSTDSAMCNMAYADSILARDNTLIRKGNFIVNPIIIDNGEAGFCLDDLQEHAESLVNGTPGVISRYNQNFLGDISKAIQINIDNMAVQGGRRQENPAVVLQRDLQLPDGKIARLRFHLYH